MTWQQRVTFSVIMEFTYTHRVHKHMHRHTLRKTVSNANIHLLEKQ